MFSRTWALPEVRDVCCAGYKTAPLEGKTGLGLTHIRHPLTLGNGVLQRPFKPPYPSYLARTRSPGGVSGGHAHSPKASGCPSLTCSSQGPDFGESS